MIILNTPENISLVAKLLCGRKCPTLISFKVVWESNIKTRRCNRIIIYGKVGRYQFEKKRREIENFLFKSVFFSIDHHTFFLQDWPFPIQDWKPCTAFIHCYSESMSSLWWILQSYQLVSLDWESLPKVESFLWCWNTDF